MRPHRQQPTSLPRPWDSPGKNTGVGCHFLLQCMKVKSEREVAQSCPTLCDPMDCSPPGSSVCGIFQATVLEWAAISLGHLPNLGLEHASPTSQEDSLAAEPLGKPLRGQRRGWHFRQMERHLQRPWGRRQWHPTPVLLPGKSHRWRSMMGCSLRGH